MIELMIRFVGRGLICGFLGAVGFGLIINVPKRSVVLSAFLGGIAYMFYDVILFYSNQIYVATFFASLLVAVYSELLARKFKMPAIIFIVPGIVALVPGVGLYKTILRLIDNDFFGFLQQGTETIFVACAIAAAIAVVNITVRTVYSRFKHKI